jgi:site-specific DNA recombinase
MFLKIIGIFAEFERENIIERVKVGIERKVQEGYKIGGPASYGYDYSNEQTDERKVQTVNADEAAVVREIFDMFVNQGVSITDIARRLNVRKIPTKQNTIWGSTAIRRLLANVNYIGHVRHHVRDEKREYSVEGRHEPIIEQALFATAQKLLANNKKATPRKLPREDNYFSGFLTCGECGYKMVTHNVYNTLKDGSKSVTGGYYCRNKTLGVCTTGTISHRKLERAFEEHMEEMADLDVSDKIEIEERKKLENIQQIQAYEEKRRQLEAKEHQALQLYVANEMEFESYRDIKKMVDKQKAVIAEELKRLQGTMAEDTQINKADIISNFRQNWSALSASQRRQFLLQFVGKITLTVGKENGGHFSKAKILDVAFLPSMEKQRVAGKKFKRLQR